MEHAQSLLRASFGCPTCSYQPIMDTGVRGDRFQCPCLQAVSQTSSEEAHPLLASFPFLYHFFPPLLVYIEHRHSNPVSESASGQTQPKTPDAVSIEKFIWEILHGLWCHTDVGLEVSPATQLGNLGSRSLTPQVLICLSEK